MALTTFVASQVLTAQQLNDSFAAVGGLRATVPTSATVTGAGSSASVGTNGKVTFASAESLSINGCFSASFTNYVAVCDFDTNLTLNVNARLRVAGADNSTSNSYVYQSLNVSSTTVAGARTTTNLWLIGGGTTAQTNGFVTTFYRPFLADSTNYASDSSDSSSNAYITKVNGTHNQNTSYDGFTLICSTGNITGSITVYGYFG